MPATMRLLDSRAADFAERLAELRRFEVVRDDAVEEAVAKTLEDVRIRGDAALLAATRRFDGFDAASVSALRVSKAEMNAALASLSPENRAALTEAAARVRSYHERQRQSTWEFTDSLGNRLGQRVLPMARVGIYVPGGQAAYPSTVLMTAIPARVAGVRELVVTAPTPNGVRNSLVLAAAALAEVDEVFCVGGAQAVAAMAFGTESIRPVDKIVGPGGDYVAVAKRMVFGKVGIDMIAGPSEVVVVADTSLPVEWAVADLFSQAEHDAAAQAILIATDAEYASRIVAAIEESLQRTQRADIVARSLSARGAVIVARDRQEAIAISNRIAPEHLQLCVESPRDLLPLVEHAGAVFIGIRSSEVFGDYVAGPSHVLPTFGTARFSSVLGVYDFQRRVSVIEVSERGAATLGSVAAQLAAGEGLVAHRDAARLRADAYANAGDLHHGRDS